MKDYDFTICFVVFFMMIVKKFLYFLKPWVNIISSEVDLKTRIILFVTKSKKYFVTVTPKLKSHAGFQCLHIYESFVSKILLVIQTEKIINGQYFHLDTAFYKFYCQINPGTKNILFLYSPHFQNKS